VEVVGGGLVVAADIELSGTGGPQLGLQDQRVDCKTITTTTNKLEGRVGPEVTMNRLLDPFGSMIAARGASCDGPHLERLTERHGAHSVKLFTLATS